jgi:hypothetical protein
MTNPIVAKSEIDPNDRWINIVTWSDGRIERLPVSKCPCGLDKERLGINPIEYHMYALLFARLVEFGQFEFLKEQSNCSLQELVDQFAPKARWIDDIVTSMFKCRQCGDVIDLTVNTYRGGGGFRREKGSAKL